MSSACNTSVPVRGQLPGVFSAGPGARWSLTRAAITGLRRPGALPSSLAHPPTVSETVLLYAACQAFTCGMNAFPSLCVCACACACMHACACVRTPRQQLTHASLVMNENNRRANLEHSRRMPSCLLIVLLCRLALSSHSLLSSCRIHQFESKRIRVLQEPS